MENIILGMYWGILLGLVISSILYLAKTGRIFFNSNVKYIADERFFPKFEIINVEISYDGKNNRIAKYTILNSFFAKKK